MKIDLLSFSLFYSVSLSQALYSFFPSPFPPKSVVTPPVAYVAHNTLTLCLLLS